MLAFCNEAIVKLLLIGVGLLLHGFHTPAVSSYACCSRVVTVSATPARDTSAAGGPSKKEKPVKITITDEGIKIGSEGKDKVILEVDSDKLSKINAEVLRKLEQLPESLEAVFDENEDNRFFREKEGDIVQIGTKIVVEKDELANGDVVSILSNIVIEGKVMGDVAAIFGNVELGPDAIVNGEVVSILGSVTRQDGAVVRGETAVIGGRYPHRGLVFPFGPFGEGIFGAGAKIVVFIISVLLILMVLYFISERMTKASVHVGESFLKSFGIGLLVLFAGTILVIVLAVILAITIVGIPVAVLLVLSFVALFVLGYFVAALALGRFVGKKLNMESESVYLHGIIGLFLLSILDIIASFMFLNPWMGPFKVIMVIFAALIKFVAVVVGVGAFIVSRGGSRPHKPKVTLPE
jgi:hypothetical protein